MKVRLQDILWAERKIRVRRKGGNEQLVPFPLDVLREDLVTYIDMREDLLSRKGVSSPYLFVSAKRGLPLREVDIARVVKAVVKGMGLSVRITPHTFRHSLAMAMLSRGTPVHVVKEVLGHSSLNTTMRYVHLIKGEAQEAVAELGKALLAGEEHSQE